MRHTAMIGNAGFAYDFRGFAEDYGVASETFAGLTAPPI